MASEKRFKDYNWKKMAAAIGFELVEDKGDSVIIRRHNEYDVSYLLSENGGELNVTKIAYTPVGDNSVPYWDNRCPGGAVGPITLACRVAQQIDGEPIDYAMNEDKLDDGAPISLDELIP